MSKNMVRLNKYLADCGICSRREADKMIDAGRVLVNGITATMGYQVQETDSVSFNGKIVENKNSKVVLAFYKPVGVTCTEKDKYADQTITDYLNYPIRITYAGRLDKDSEGLIIMTNDGELINRMMRAANKHEKEYLVKVDKEITPHFLAQMSKGVYLKDLEETTRECQVTSVGKFSFRIILTQGLNRQIRRMCKTLGYEVKLLQRIRIMNIEIGTLQSGEYRELAGKEIETLYESVGLKI
ncbi:MAG TPA: pseudouridine synthase [Lachnospiraceae bacterium]|nr:pseudouridine synthase [Lachnospiraceae bacterium]